MIKSAYIHVPFCKTICSYCDFCKYIYQHDFIVPYLDALEMEIQELYQGEELETIYIGGGTPTSLDIEEFKRLLSIVDFLRKKKTVEYTVECNIENITEEKVRLMVAHGVNRISVGVETFQNEQLKFLNRSHTKKEVLKKIQMIKQYCANINIDLIYALPNETEEELENDLELILSLDVPHISTYSLMIEEHTVLYNRKIKPIDEDVDAKMYEQIQRKLKDYHHYEISNFAKEGYESKHNLTYWNNLEYYGFGLGASGYIHSRRYMNTRSMNHYLKGLRVWEEEILTKQEKMENEFILGFRKVEGISVSLFKEKYQIDPFKLPVVVHLLQNKKLQTDGEFIWIDKKYLYVSNGILMEFLDFEN